MAETRSEEEPKGESRARLEGVVARAIDVGDAKHARDAAALLVTQIVTEGAADTEADYVEEARKRYFLRVDERWNELLHAVAEGRASDATLIDCLKEELQPRVPNAALRLRVGMRCRDIARELLHELRADVARGEDPGRAKHRACVSAWSLLVSEHIDDGLPSIRDRTPSQPLPDYLEKHANETLQLLAFVELVDLRAPEGVKIVLGETPPIPPRPQGGPFNEEIGEGWKRRHRRDKLVTRPGKPPANRPLTDGEEAKLEEAAWYLKEAVPLARQSLVDSGSAYVGVLDRLVTGDHEADSEQQRTRAFYRLGRALNAVGFACGKPFDDPDAFVGARHVFPPGASPMVDQLTGRQAVAMRCEAIGRETENGSMSALPLVEIAKEARYSWPSTDDADDSEWTDVEQLLVDLREARKRARVRRQALYEGDPFSTMPRRLPRRFSKPRSDQRQGGKDDVKALFEYGRVIVLPEDAIPIEALARRAGKYPDVLPRDLHKVHVGEWYFFPRKGIHV